MRESQDASRNRSSNPGIAHESIRAYIIAKLALSIGTVGGHIALINEKCEHVQMW